MHPAAPRPSGVSVDTALGQDRHIAHQVRSAGEERTCKPRLRFAVRVISGREQYNVRRKAAATYLGRVPRETVFGSQATGLLGLRARVFTPNSSTVWTPE
jgi:hypothetical protein